MRKIVSLSLLVLAIVGFSSSCGGDEPTPSTPQSKGSITLTPSEYTASSDAQQLSFNVNADVDWSVSTAESWISLFPNGGLKNSPTDVRVTITANTAMEQRVGRVVVRSGAVEQVYTLTQQPQRQLNLPASDLRISAKAQQVEIAVVSNADWTATTTDSWIKVAKHDQEAVTLDVQANDTEADRAGTVTFAYASAPDQVVATATIRQLTDAIDIPEGYALVWNDEFNDDNASITDLWTYDVQGPGWVNNELQRYVPGGLNGVKTAEIHDGMLTITAQKVGNEVISARLNSRQGWTYGIMEARLCLPKGKGTWPAFWMYPSKPDGNWPYCGEIDIMEEVGCVPDEVSSSIHCKAYNHPNNTQKTAARKLPGAEGEFHVYRLEWTEDYIRTYVDGQQLFYFPNDKKGSRDTWPYDYDFKIILNLAWGGSWGGMYGVDESALPVKYDIDYVRVFQKK